MWEFFIKNSKFAYLFLVALVAVGAYALVTIPKESSPEVVIPVGVVTTILPGAPAADIETLITNDIERGLSSLENVKQITSVSREGVSNITVEFEADADLDTSIQDLKDEVDSIAVELPSDAEDPRVSEVSFVDQPIMTVAVSADLSDFAFNTLANQLEDEIESISGVSRVSLSGVRDREVTVIVDQVELARYELTIADVVNGIQSANLTFPIGQIENNGVSYNVAFEGDIANSAQIQDVSIGSRAGQPIYVRDIATVEDGLAPASSISRLSIAGAPSQSSISLDVYKQSGGDITRIASAVNTRVEELKATGEILDGINTVTVLDSGEQIESDLIRLTGSGLQTVVLVMLLLVIAIGWREGLLAGAAIPLSFLFGFIGLYFSGNTINFLSLFSLILGIGILVDSAIVMVEGINRRMKDDPTIDKHEAALKAIHEFKAPLISGTLTTVSMFAGLLIVSGVIGQFIASIPFTLIFLLFASLFVSLAIIPLLASGFLRRRNATNFEAKQVEYAHKLETWYQSKLRAVLDEPRLQYQFLSGLVSVLVLAISLTFNVIGGLLVLPLVYVFTYRTFMWQERRNWAEWKRMLLWFPGVVVIIGLTFAIAGTVLPSFNTVSVTFFEQGDVDYVIVEVENPEGTVKEVTDVDVRRVEELLLDEPDIESYVVTVGSGSQFGSGGAGEKFANIFVTLADDRTRTSTEVTEHLRQEVALLNDLKVTVNQPSDGPPTGAAIIVKFLGDDLNELTSLANESVKILESIPETVNVESSTNSNSTEFVLELDRAKAAALGLNPMMVSQIVRTAVYGSEATSLTTLDDDINVVVRLNIDSSSEVTAETANHTSINALEEIVIQTQSGSVPLSSLVMTRLRESSAVVNHEDGRRVVSVTADVSSAGNAREIQTQAIERIEEELAMSDNVEISTGGGETDESNQAFIEMFVALIVGVLLMVGVLVLQFNSYLHMRYVLSILPYSLIGIMFGLTITFNPLSFPSIMGFIALSGIVVNNSILLIDMMNQLRKERPAMAVKEIVIHTAGNRLRPILLTTTTTVIGMVPLTYAGDLWAPLAYAVMFGLIFSVFITLLLIPIIYLRNPGEVS